MLHSLPALHERGMHSHLAVVPEMPRIIDVSQFPNMGVLMLTCITGNATTMTRPLTLAIFVLASCSTGCLHPRIGPQSLPRDRADYSNSLSDSWKEETLLNIVKVRYLDPPVFVEWGMLLPVILWPRLPRLAEQSCPTEAAMQRWALRQVLPSQHYHI